jgi:hypothetical protein
MVTNRQKYDQTSLTNLFKNRHKPWLQTNELKKHVSNIVKNMVKHRKQMITNRQKHNKHAGKGCRLCSLWIIEDFADAYTYTS